MPTRRYVYKVTKGGVYKGLLTTVISDFSYSQDINTAGTEITIELGSSLSSAGATATSNNVVDELGATITDQNSVAITTDVIYSYTTIPIDLGNIIEVTEFSTYYVNGSIVFSGIITSWKTNFETNTIQLRVQSQGVKLNEYLVSIPALTAQVQSMPAYVSAYSVYPTGTPVTTRKSKLSQSFTVPSNISLAQVQIYVSVSSTPTQIMTVSLMKGIAGAGGATLATSTVTLAGGSYLQNFAFAQTIPLVTATTYSLAIEFTSTDLNQLLNVGNSTLNPYANGNAQYYASSAWTVDALTDIWFTLYTNGSSIGHNFQSVDPSEMISSILSTAIISGSPISYSTSTIASTGTVATYNFKFDRVSDGIKKCLELAPAGWYWYVNRGTNLLYFKYRSQTANHTFILGKHIAKLDMEYTLENMANVAYLSGGETAGVNLLTVNTDQASLTSYGRFMETISDNRVTVTATASAITQQTLDTRSQPSFRTSVTILSVAYDIETIELGQGVSFTNAGTFINTLLLQIVGIDRTPDSIRLRLDNVLPTVAHRIEDLARNVERINTVKNPSDAS